MSSSNRSRSSDPADGGNRTRFKLGPNHRKSLLVRESAKNALLTSGNLLSDLLRRSRSAPSRGFRNRLQTLEARNSVDQNEQTLSFADKQFMSFPDANRACQATIDKAQRIERCEKVSPNS